MLYELSMPAAAVFGRGCRHRLTAALPPGPVQIICGTHSFKRISAELGAALSGREVHFVADFPAEAPLDRTETALESARKIHAASIIGWGGGSCIDAAKTVAALLHAPGSVADAFHGKLAINRRDGFFAALPTTAGTAAEMSPNAVLHDSATGIKKSLRGEGMFPDLALVDPELVDGAPDSVLFSAGFDSLTQGIECTISNRADTATRFLSIEGTFLAWRGLQQAAAGDRSPAVSDDLARGCMLTGAAFVRTGLGAVHGIGHPVSGLRGVPHGVCCAILLVEVLRWNLDFARDPLTQLANRLGYAAPEALIDAVAELRAKCGLPENFKSYHFTAADWPFVVQNCRSGSMKCNPRDLSDAEVNAILERLT